MVLSKPFAIEELLARIRVALKRREATVATAADTPAAPEPDHHVLSIKGVTMDVERHEVKVGDGEMGEYAARLLCEGAESLYSRPNTRRPI